MSQKRVEQACLGVGPEEGVPHFVVGARPVAVPAELIALPPDARITSEYDVAGMRGSATGRAGDLRSQLEAVIQRQREGYFTLVEAAQALADARPETSAKEALKRFLIAHANKALPVHLSGSRFLVEHGEQVSDWHDLLYVPELDAWLRRTTGYGFPCFVEPQAATQPRYIAGCRLWELSEAIEHIAAMPAFGVPATALTERVQRDAEKGKMTLRDLITGEPTMSDGMALFLRMPLYAEDFNAWLATAGYPEPYRLPTVDAVTSPVRSGAPEPSLWGEVATLPGWQLNKPADVTPAAPGKDEPGDRMKKRAALLELFRAEDGKRPGEVGKKGKRGALQRVVEKSGIDKDTLGLMLDKAIEEKRCADAFAHLTAKR